MDTAKIRQRMSHVAESLDVGRDIEPHEVHALLGDLDVLVAMVDQMKPLSAPLGGDRADDQGEPPPGYETFNASQFAQDLFKSMRDVTSALTQAWAVAKNPAKVRISNAKSEVDRLLRVLGAGAKFAIMTNKEAR
jgi:hypothetical protein